MKCVSSMIVLLFVFPVGTSVKWISEWKLIYSDGPHFFKNQTICEGDYCISYSDKNERESDKDCSSGWHQTIGCWTEKESERSVCACNSEKCNAVKMSEQLKELPTHPVPIYNCDYYYVVYGDNSTKEQFKDNHTGTLCTIEITSDMESTPFRALVARGSTDRLPILLKKNVFGFDEYAHVGGIYAETYAYDNYHISYRCRGDFCNRDFDTSWITAREDVRCHRTSYNSITDDECSGEYCTFYHEPNTWEQPRGCLTTNQTMAEGNYSVGVYKSRSLTIYLCKGWYCNRNLTTVQKWIEDYRNGVARAATPVYGRPYSLEENVWKNEGTSTSRCFILCSLVILSYLFLE